MLSTNKPLKQQMSHGPKKTSVVCKKWWFFPPIGFLLVFQYYLGYRASRNLMEGRIQEVTRVWIPKNGKISLEPDFSPSIMTVSHALLQSRLTGGTILTVGSTDASIRVYLQEKIHNQNQQLQEKSNLQLLQQNHRGLVASSLKQEPEQPWRLVSFRRNKRPAEAVLAHTKPYEAFIGLSSDGRIAATKDLDAINNTITIRIFKRRSTDEELLASNTNISVVSSDLDNDSDWEEDLLASKVLSTHAQAHKKCFGFLAALSGNGQVIAASVSDYTAENVSYECKVHDRHTANRLVFQVYQKNAETGEWRQTGFLLGEDLLEPEERIQPDLGWDLSMYNFAATLNDDGTVLALAGTVEWDRVVFTKRTVPGTNRTILEDNEVESYRLDTARVYRHDNTTGWKLVGQSNILAVDPTKPSQDSGGGDLSDWKGTKQVSLSEDGAYLSVACQRKCEIYEFNAKTALWVRLGRSIQGARALMKKCIVSSTTTTIPRKGIRKAKTIVTPTVTIYDVKLVSVLDWLKDDWSAEGDNFIKAKSSEFLQVIALVKQKQRTAAGAGGVSSSSSLQQPQRRPTYSLYLSSYEFDESRQTKHFIKPFQRLQVVKTFYRPSWEEEKSEALVWKKVDPDVASLPYDRQIEIHTHLSVSSDGGAVSILTRTKSACFQRSFSEQLQESSSSTAFVWEPRSTIFNSNKEGEQSMFCQASTIELQDKRKEECGVRYFQTISGNNLVGIEHAMYDPEFFFRVCGVMDRDSDNNNNKKKWKKLGDTFNRTSFGTDEKRTNIEEKARMVKIREALFTLNFKGDILAVSQKGTTRVFKYEHSGGSSLSPDGRWIQLGQSIDIDHQKDDTTDKLALSEDGKFVAVTSFAPSSAEEKTPNSLDSRSFQFTTRVYKYHSDSGIWTQLGQSLEPSELSNMLISMIGSNKPVIILFTGKSISAHDFVEETTTSPSSSSLWVQRGKTVSVECCVGHVVLSNDGNLMGIQTIESIYMYEWNAVLNSWQQLGSFVSPTTYAGTFSTFAFTEPTVEKTVTAAKSNETMYLDTKLFVVEKTNDKTDPKIIVSEWKLMSSNAKYLSEGDEDMESEMMS